MFRRRFPWSWRWALVRLFLCRRKRVVAVVVLAGTLVYFTSYPVTDPYNVTFQRVKRLLNDHHHILKKELKGREENIQMSPNPSTYRRRQQRIKHFCHSKRGYRSSFSMLDFLSRSWFVEKYKLLYCEVPKVGCTFWKRTLEVLRRHHQHLNSPYQLLYEECKRGEKETLRSISQDKSGGYRRSEIISKLYTKFMFTREPFERLFSSYVDKFFSPNELFWSLGRYHIFPLRANKTFRGRLPGHDVTFEEFIHFILRTEDQYLDAHLKPVYRVCDVCNIQFNIVGKMETFQTDAFHIISSINASRNLVFRDFQLESTVDTIVDLVGKVFQYRQTVESFLDFEDILRRVWRRLKIANILDSRQPFPFTKTDIPFIQMEEFTRVIIDLYKRSLNTTRNNKKVAFLQAYRQLSDKTLSDLRDMYRPDFELFDYDITGPHLAQIQESLTSADMEYDYFDIIR